MTGGFDIEASRERCRRYRRRILEVSQSVPAVHIAPAFSCLEIVDTVYFGFIRPSEGADVFILSKGHGAMAQYAVLEELGILKPEDVESLGRDGSTIGMHPDLGVPGIEASTGSLGHGLPIALGMAYGHMLSGQAPRVFVVLSDGELQEGSVWEALMLAPSLGLNGIVCVVDLNDFLSLGRLSEAYPSFYPVGAKLEAFGWEAAEVDGHDQAALYGAIAGRSGERPLAVVARTTKGKGVSFMENAEIWHYRSPNPEEYERALREIGAA